MKTVKSYGAGYKAPELQFIDIMTEGVLCASGEKMWYEKSGTGDFSYGIDTDDTWA